MAYSFFGDIVCINLETRPDRKLHSSNVFNQLNIPAKYVTVKKHAKGGIYGCFDSHISVLLKAYNEGKDNLLVFEDDIIPTDSYDITHITNGISFMQNNKEWDIFYYGYFVFNYDIQHPFITSSRAIGYNNIIQYNPFATHAMVYSRRGMEKIVKTYQNYLGKLHYDIYLAGHTGLRNFCYTPILFDQRLCFASDIEPNNQIERVARNMQCFADRNKVLYKVSLFKYFIDAYNHIILLLIMSILVVALLYVWKMQSITSI